MPPGRDVGVELAGDRDAEAMTRIGIASLGGMSICRAALICPAARSMLTNVILCSHLRW